MARDFRPEFARFMGGPAYSLVAQSLILRLPLMLRPLLSCERLYTRLPGRYPFPYLAARWRRLAHA